jgi:hypothetical protein
MTPRDTDPLTVGWYDPERPHGYMNGKPYWQGPTVSLMSRTIAPSDERRRTRLLVALALAAGFVAGWALRR